MKSKTTKTALMRALEEIQQSRGQVGDDEFTIPQVSRETGMTSEAVRGWLRKRLKAGAVTRRSAVIDGCSTWVYRYADQQA